MKRDAKAVLSPAEGPGAKAGPAGVTPTRFSAAVATSRPTDGGAADWTFPVEPDRLPFAEARARQSAPALDLAGAAAMQRETAAAREREAAARARALQLATANEALQAMVEAVATATGPDELLPAVLGIVDRAFGASCCAYFEQLGNGSLELRFWSLGGRVCGPDQFDQLAPSQKDLLTRLAPPVRPFPRPPCHSLSARAVLVDPTPGDGRGEHGAPEIVAFVGERAEGTLVIRRRETEPFSMDELALAETLAMQVGVANRSARLARQLSNQAVEAAVARERESAAKERAEKLGAANALLLRTAESLNAIQDIDAFLARVLLTITTLAGARSATAWVHNAETQSTQLRFVVQEGLAVPARESRHPGAADPRVLTIEAAPLLHGLRPDVVKPVQQDIRSLPVGSSGEWRYFDALGVRSLVFVPMVLNSQHLGNFCIHLTQERRLAQDEYELIQALANQAAVALHLARLADQAREAAVAREQRHAAHERAAELAQANAALKRSLDLLATGSDLERFLAGVLSEIGRVLRANACVLWTRDAAAPRVDVDAPNARLTWSALNATADQPGGTIAEVLQAALLRFVPAEVCRPCARHRVCDLGPFGDEDLVALATAGVTDVIHIPLVLGTQSVGGIAVALAAGAQAGADHIELVRAFAHQATLALRLQALSAESRISAVLEERARIARDLHDAIAQTFIGISMQLHSWQEVLDLPPIQRAAKLAEHGLAEARRAIKALRPMQLSTKPFMEALASTARDMLPESIAFRIATTGEWPHLAPDREANLFRLVQEAFNNVVKHSRATLLKVEVSSTPKELSILVQDNGRGFSMRDEARQEGFGLHSMRQRAASAHADVQIVSRPGRGTQVFVSLDPAEQEI